MILKTVQFLEPERVFFRPCKIETAGAHNLFQGHLAEICLDEFRIRVQPDDDLAGCVALFRRCGADLVEDDDVSELYLLHQKVDNGAVVAITRRFTPAARKSDEP